ncbi:hypothetical protein NUW58_g330 [Xylaria curta]|uniref:Uncharacterized protein n=1 Tax=Xylaria curta TaxID=42375 RepID=A0ACC1PPS9_9PEZI|nr:hypothetical protein NUW58_g330 [Xylaria curta]
MNSQSTPIQRRKRTNADVGSDEAMDDRTPTQKSYSQHQRTDGQRSPKKSKGNSKTRDLLLQLETPVNIKPWDLSELRSQEGFGNVEELLRSINTYSQGNLGVVPNEVRKHFTAIYEKRHGIEPVSSWFRMDPMPSTVVGSNPYITATTRAEIELEVLQEIQDEAASSKTENRHEGHWASMVYASLLRHVFKQEVRVENVSTATMEGDSIPFLREPGTGSNSSASNGLDISSEFCVTVTGSSLSSIYSIKSMLKGTRDPRNLAHVQSRGGVKIVDFALVMNPPEQSPLREAISNLITEICDEGRRHVNQTAYQPIKDNVIAVSIEAKTELSAVDPLLQLGLWTAAWHKRMRALRRELFAAHTAGIHDEGRRLMLCEEERRKRLITVPVVTVVGHQWDMYFAFFGAHSITMHGPVKLGCTGSLLDTYVLVASLRAIQGWIQKTFKKAMEDWFMVDPSTAQI